LKKNSKAFENIAMVLPQLRRGKKYVVNNLNFVGNSHGLLPESLPVQYNLYKLMEKNKKLKIVIEGHVNGPNSANTEGFKELSKLRSESVYDYLISKGIDASRISKQWFGNSKMLFPTTKDEKEMMLNRRVEIKVEDF
jgi:outer membrane protein OmpA-like peptidoglycan-associated protein